MRRLLWPLSVLVAFALGLAAGSLPRPSMFSQQEAEDLRDAEDRRATARGARAAGLGGGGVPGARPGTAARYATDRSGADRALAGASEGLARPGTRAPGSGVGDEPAAGARGDLAAVGAKPSVQGALDRFYRYLDEVGELTGRARYQRGQQILDELRAMGSAGTEALMRVLASGSSSDERRAAAQLLGDLQASQAVPLLQNVLDKDGDVLLRRSAASALRRLQTPDTVPVLDTLLANPAEDRFVRMSAASGLAHMGRPQGVTALAQIFDEANGDGRGRDLAFRAMASLNDDRALPFMRRVAASDAELTYRLQAIRFLAAQGDRQAVASLQQVAQSPAEQPSIRDAAAQALTALGGK